eukprot:2116674-Rhodomonas_salina.1
MVYWKLTLLTGSGVRSTHSDHCCPYNRIVQLAGAIKCNKKSAGTMTAVVPADQNYDKPTVNNGFKSPLKGA